MATIAPAPSRINELLIPNLKDTVVVPVGAPVTRTSIHTPCSKITMPEQPVSLSKESRRIIFPSLYKRPAQVHAASETSPNRLDAFPFVPEPPFSVSNNNKKTHHVPELSSSTLKGHNEEILLSRSHDTPFSFFLALFKHDDAPVNQQLPNSASAVYGECTSDSNRNDQCLPKADHLASVRVRITCRDRDTKITTHKTSQAASLHLEIENVSCGKGREQDSIRGLGYAFLGFIRRKRESDFEW
jgi:hypothetical protein